MMHMIIIFAMLEVTEVEIAHRGAQLNINDVQDIKFYTAEIDLNTANVDTSILAECTVEVEATMAPKVLPPQNQEAARAHLAAEYQEVVAQGSSQKRLITVRIKQKRTQKEILTRKEEMMELHIMNF